MQFSDHKKQILVGKYPTEYKELVNAYLYESQERVNNLCHRFEGEEMKISDLRALVALAQDFVASYRLLEGINFPSPLRNASVGAVSSRWLWAVGGLVGCLSAKPDYLSLNYEDLLTTGICSF